MSTVIGYFNWRATAKGGVTPEKILKEQRDPRFHSKDATIKAKYVDSLLQETSIGEDLWNKSLDELAAIYPAPEAKVKPSPLAPVEAEIAYSISTRVVSIEDVECTIGVEKDSEGKWVTLVEKRGWHARFEGSWESLFISFEKPDLIVGQEVEILICPKKDKKNAK